MTGDGFNSGTTKNLIKKESVKNMEKQTKDRLWKAAGHACQAGAEGARLGGKLLGWAGKELGKGLDKAADHVKEKRKKSTLSD